MTSRSRARVVAAAVLAFAGTAGPTAASRAAETPRPTAYRTLTVLEAVAVPAGALVPYEGDAWSATDVALVPVGDPTRAPVEYGGGVDLGEEVVGAAGVNGSVWAAGDGRAVRVASNGTVVAFDLDIEGRTPADLAPGPEGDLWYSDTIGGTVSRLIPGRAPRHESLPPITAPDQLVAGASWVWATEVGTATVAALAPDGTVRSWNVGEPFAGRPIVSVSGEAYAVFTNDAEGTFYIELFGEATAVPGGGGWVASVPRPGGRAMVRRDDADVITLSTNLGMRAFRTVDGAVGDPVPAPGGEWVMVGPDRAYFVDFRVARPSASWNEYPISFPRRDEGSGSRFVDIRAGYIGSLPAPAGRAATRDLYYRCPGGQTGTIRHRIGVEPDSTVARMVASVETTLWQRLASDCEWSYRRLLDVPAPWADTEFLLPSSRLPPCSAEPHFWGYVLRDVLDRNPVDSEPSKFPARVMAGGRARFASEVLATTEAAQAEAKRTWTSALGRYPSTSKYIELGDLLLSGATPAEVRALVVGGSEFSARHPSDDEWVDAAYLALLGRAADPAGRAHWVEVLEDGASRAGVARSFQRSTEGAASRVSDLYQRYLGRSLDPNGHAHWVPRLRTGAVTERSLSVTLMSSSEYGTGRTPACS